MPTAASSLVAGQESESKIENCSNRNITGEMKLKLTSAEANKLLHKVKDEQIVFLMILCPNQQNREVVR